MASGQMLLLKGPRSRPLTGDENQPLKPKSQRSGVQVALTVSSAEATASTRGSLTYGDHHLSTDDIGHLPTNTAPASGRRPKAHRCNTPGVTMAMAHLCTNECDHMWERLEKKSIKPCEPCINQEC
jgi:hypothetical protein